MEKGRAEVGQADRHQPHLSSVLCLQSLVYVFREEHSLLGNPDFWICQFQFLGRILIIKWKKPKNFFKVGEEQKTHPSRYQMRSGHELSWQRFLIQQLALHVELKRKKERNGHFFQRTLF